jgi:hypothetical protein
MAILNIVKTGDDILKKKSRPVEKIDERILTLLEDMKETMYENDGMGLAAPQVGVLRRAIVMEVNGNYYELINPEIVYEEGVKTKTLLDQTINEYNQTKSLLEQGICPHCLQKIDTEVFNNRQIEIMGNGKELNDKVIKLRNDLKVVKNKQTDLDNFILKLNQDKDTVNKATGIRNTLGILSSNIDNLKLKISNLESQKNTIKNNEVNMGDKQTLINF